MDACLWMDLSHPDPALPLSRLPASGTCGVLGACLAADRAAKPRGAALICPGGAYAALAEHEALPVARLLNGLGIHAFILRYRHAPHFRHPAPLDDAKQAMRIIRHGAATGWWAVQPGKVAVMGFSAGGHLAAMLANDRAVIDPEGADPLRRQPSRPDAHVLAYPVIHLSKPDSHQESRQNLLGADAPADLVESLDAEKLVSADTPPAFLFHTMSDATVSIMNSLSYALALVRFGVPLDLHVFQPGGHGLGLASEYVDVQSWIDLLARWFKRMEY